MRNSKQPLGTCQTTIKLISKKDEGHVFRRHVLKTKLSRSFVHMPIPPTMMNSSRKIHHMLINFRLKILKLPIVSAQGKFAEIQQPMSSIMERKVLGLVLLNGLKDLSFKDPSMESPPMQYCIFYLEPLSKSRRLRSDGACGKIQ